MGEGVQLSAQQLHCLVVVARPGNGDISSDVWLAGLEISLHMYVKIARDVVRRCYKEGIVEEGRKGGREGVREGGRE